MRVLMVACLGSLATLLAIFRAVTGAHTVAQVVVGAILGVATAVAWFKYVDLTPPACSPQLCSWCSVWLGSWRHVL